jgi:2-hydroxycyclohexanecarboxyl-CoA dehydrogenase
MTLEGRVAMVTGGGRGIGAAIAARLARLGASVAVCDLDATTAQSTAAALPANGLAVRMDVSSSAEVVDAVARIGDELGPIDLLVNNAGFDVIEPFMDSAEETWDRLWQVNLKGQIICCQAVLAAHMIPNQRGRIVNIGSDAGRVGSTGEAVYSATKGGVIAFTKTLAREMARHQITVNCVCPGPTDTPLLAQLGHDKASGLRGALTKAIPLRREAEPDDIAAVVTFLCTDDASYMTGQIVSVSGGLTMV